MEQPWGWSKLLLLVKVPAHSKGKLEHSGISPFLAQQRDWETAAPAGDPLALEESSAAEIQGVSGLFTLLEQARESGP